MLKKHSLNAEITILYPFHDQKALKVTKICNIHFWIENDAPAPPFGTFPKNHPIWWRDPSLIIIGHLLRLLPGHPQGHVGLNAILSADEQERSVADNVVKCRINSLRKIQTKKMQKWQNCTPKKDNMIESKLNE